MLLTIIALLLFITMIVVAVFSIKYRLYSNDKLIIGLALLLIIYKTIELSFEIFILGNLGKYPVEFSTMFYFIFPIIILTKAKRLYGIGSIGAFVSGFGYLLTLVFSINSLFYFQVEANNVHGFIIGMLSHSVLFYLSILMLSKYKFDFKKELLLANLVAVAILAHAQIMSYFIDFTKYNLFVFMLNNGTLISFIPLDGFIFYIINFLIIALVYNVFIFGFYKLNSYLYDLNLSSLELKI